MERNFVIKKGLDLKLEGEAARTLDSLLLRTEVALQPADFQGVVPRVRVKEGESVQAGTPLFVDKQTEQICFVSPVSGTVTLVERGERRKVLSIRVQPDSKQVSREFGVQNWEKFSGEEMKKLLLESGMFAFFRQRPYDVTACPTDTPKAIFVSAFNKMPLAADFSYVVEGQEEDFKNGIRALSKLAKVHLGISGEQINTGILPIKEAEVSVFDGPNPAGNVGVQINHIDPINKGEVAWTMAAEEVIFIGRLLRTGKVDFTRRIALAGSEVKEPRYMEVTLGAKIGDIVNGNLLEAKHLQRIIRQSACGPSCLRKVLSRRPHYGSLHFARRRRRERGFRLDYAAFEAVFDQPQLFQLVDGQEIVESRLPREGWRASHDYERRIRACFPDGHLSVVSHQGHHLGRHRPSGSPRHLRGGTGRFRRGGVYLQQ